MSDWLNESLASVVAGLRTVDAAEWDDERCVTALALLETLTREARTVESVVHTRLLVLMEPGQVCAVPGVGQVQVQAGGKRRTLGSKLARQVAAFVADMPCDAEGEKLPPGALCQQVADELTVVFGLDNATQSFRAGEVKARNLRPGDFQVYEDGSPRVRFVGGAA